MSLSADKTLAVASSSLCCWEKSSSAGFLFWFWRYIAVLEFVKSMMGFMDLKVLFSGSRAATLWPTLNYVHWSTLTFQEYDPKHWSTVWVAPIYHCCWQLFLQLHSLRVLFARSCWDRCICRVPERAEFLFTAEMNTLRTHSAAEDSCQVFIQGLYPHVLSRIEQQKTYRVSGVLIRGCVNWKVFCYFRIAKHWRIIKNAVILKEITVKIQSKQTNKSRLCKPTSKLILHGFCI